MDDAHTIPLSFLIFAAAVLVIFSMIFSAAESAFLSVNKLRIRLLKDKRDKKAERVWHLLENKDRLINTLLVGNNIVNIALSSVFAFVAIRIFGQAGVGVATFAVTILLLIFGEISPKTIATHHPESVAFFFCGFVEVMETVLSPLVFVFTFFAKRFLKIFGVEIGQKKISYTEEEIKTFLDVGHEQGVLRSGEKKMMNRVFKFTDLEAKDIMVPRKKIKAIPLNEKYQTIIELAQRFRLSRFPVYKNDIDDIVGILYIKDMMKFKNPSEKFSVEKIMRPPLFILETKKMSGIQQMLRENSQSMAVVIDEYSGTSGVLTREDIVREIFGSVTDDAKIFSQKENFLPENSADFITDGFVRLTDLGEHLGAKFFSENCETLGGFVCEILGAIPQTGASVKFGGWKFTVVEMEENRVSKVRVTNLSAEKNGGNSAEKKSEESVG